MRIGIIETGRPPEGLKDRHGDYPDMFIDLLKAADPSLTFMRFAALEGDVPKDPRLCDGWLITGSRHGVYEHLPWMNDLEALIRAAFAAQVPVAGVCFGHQIMAQALGGSVIKSDKGWGLGMHRYALNPERPAWMTDDSKGFAIAAVHQDQVVTVPPNGRTIASSAFCENAAIAYGEIGFSVQGHPEFTEPFQRDLYEARKAILPENVVAEARSSFTRQVSDSPRVAGWIVAFLKAAQQLRQPSNEPAHAAS
jgi:GMP synthase-like glutamine amidotransferase